MPGPPFASFADDTFVVGLISDNDGGYLEEFWHLYD